MELGLIAGRRKIKDGSKYNHLFPVPDMKRTVLHHNGDVEHTVQLMSDYIQKYKKDTEKIANHLKADTLKQTLFNIYDFVYNNIQYKIDKPGEEELRRPAYLWATRTEGGDCDCLTIFICTILLNLKIPFTIRICKYDGKSYFQHVYPVVPDKIGFFIIDTVIDKFNYEKPYSTKKDFTMENLGILITGLHGVNDSNFFEDLNNFDLSEMDQDTIFDKLVKTREIYVANKALTLDAENFLKMLDYAIKYFYTPNRNKAFLILAQNEAEINKLNGCTEDDMLGEIDFDESLGSTKELTPDDLDSIIDDDDVYDFDGLGNYDEDGLGKSKRKAKRRAAKAAKKVAKVAAKAAKKAAKTQAKAAKKAARRLKKEVRIKSKTARKVLRQQGKQEIIEAKAKKRIARASGKAAVRAEKRAGKDVEEIIPEDIHAEDLTTQDFTAEDSTEAQVPSEVSNEEVANEYDMPEYDDEEIVNEEFVDDDYNDDVMEDDGSSDSPEEEYVYDDAIDGFISKRISENSQRTRRKNCPYRLKRQPLSFFRTLGVALVEMDREDALNGIDNDLYDGLLGKKERQAKRAARKAKRAKKKSEGKGFFQKVKKAIKKVGKAVKKVGLAPTRAAFLLFLKIGGLGISKKLKWGYATPAQAKKGNISDAHYTKSKAAVAKLEKAFVNTFGGKASSLKKNILASKKARLNGFIELQGLIGLGVVDPATVAIIAAAAPIVTVLVKILVDSGLMSKKEGDDLTDRVSKGIISPEDEDEINRENPDGKFNPDEIEDPESSVSSGGGKVMSWIKKHPVTTAAIAGGTLLAVTLALTSHKSKNRTKNLGEIKLT